MTTQIQNDKPKCKKMQKMEENAKKAKIFVLRFPMFAGSIFS
jgi:hypothetical protein